MVPRSLISNPMCLPFDARETERIGWFSGRINRVHTTRSDERFS
jgi:hypothetical protein